MAESAPWPLVRSVIVGLRLRVVGEGVGGAELQRLLPLVLQRVDGHDVLRTGVAGALDRVDADTADAVDSHGVTGGHVRAVDGRAPSGRHAAAEQHGLVQRGVAVDLDRRVLVDHAVLAEGADHAHGAVLAAGAGDREPLPGQGTAQGPGAPVADRLASGGAVTADTAVRDERADHAVTGRDPGHARPDLLDDSRALVPEHHGRPPSHIPGDEMEVGVAQARIGVADEDLSGLRPVEVEFLDLEALARFVEDGGPSLHRLSFGGGSSPTLPLRSPNVQPRVGITWPSTAGRPP